MHSSRMRTGRALTVSRGGVPAWSRGGVPAWSRRGVPAWSWGGVPAWSGGVYLPGPGGGVCSGGCTCLVQGVYLPGPRGVSALGGCTCLVPWGGGGCLVRYSPLPVNRMTDRCKNITLAKTSFRPVITHDSLSHCLPVCHLSVICDYVDVSKHPELDLLKLLKYCPRLVKILFQTLSLVLFVTLCNFQPVTR